MAQKEVVMISIRQINLCLGLGGLALASLSLSNAFAGPRDSAGGAGCVNSKGQVNTLYYCGAYHGPIVNAPAAPAPALSTDNPSEQIPEVTALEQYITSLPYLDEMDKGTILNAVVPSFTRKYFSTSNPPGVTAPIVSRIKAEFQAASGLGSKNLVLYGVTDVNAKMDNYDDRIEVTYLLPAFFALPTPEERMVALFHENLWVMFPNTDYSTIIGIEMAFESMVAQPDNAQRAVDFVTRFASQNSNASETFFNGGTIFPDGTRFEITNRSMVWFGQYSGYLTLLVKNDLQTGALEGFVNSQGQISVAQLFGPPSIANCILGIDSMDSCGGVYELSINYKNYVDGICRKYPKSLYLAYLDWVIEDNSQLDLSDFITFIEGNTHASSNAAENSIVKAIESRYRSSSQTPIMLQFSTDANALKNGPLSLVQPACTGFFCG